MGNRDGRGPGSGCGLYPRRKRKDWRIDEKCACCGETRFVMVADACGVERLQPRYPPAYYFPVREAIREWFTSPAWCEERRTPRAEMAHTYWGGEYFKRVNAKLNGALYNPDNDVYELGFDWVIPQKWNSKLEVGVVTLRSVGLGTETRGAKPFVKDVLLIVTTTKPKFLAPYLSELHDEFDVLEGPGIVVEDVFLKRTYVHRGWLLLAVGDAPVARCT